MLVVVVVVASILWTSGGTRAALRFALERYDASISGVVAVERITGTLGGTLVLDGVSLRDAEGRPLVAIGELELGLELAPLVGGTLAFETLEVRGVEIWFGAEQANYGDLGPPGPATPTPDGWVGPDLPIGFAGPITAEGVVVHRNLGVARSEVLVAVPRLRAQLRSMGRRAEVRIDGVTAILAEASLTVADATATLVWDDPEIRVVDLVAWTDRGIVERGDIGFDAWQQTGEVELDAWVETAGYAGEVKLPVVGAVATHVHAFGGAEQFWVELALRGEPEARVDLLLAGSIAPRLEFAGLGTVRAVPPGTMHPFTASIAAQVMRAAPDDPLRAALQLACIDCRDPLGLHAVLVAQGGATDVDARAFFAGASVVAEASSGGGGSWHAHARAELPSLRRIEAELAPWIVLPRLSGTLAVQATCAGVDANLACTTRAEGRTIAFAGLTIDRVDVRGEIALDDGTPHGAVGLVASGLRYGERRVDRLELAAAGEEARIDVELRAQAERSRARVVATIEPGVRTRVGLDRVELRHRGLRVTMTQPSTLVIGEDAVRVDELRLAVNRGIVAIHGTVGAHMHANLAIEHADLSDLAPLELPVRLAGKLEARVGMAGPLVSPDVALVADTSGLVVDGHRLGRIGVAVDLDDGRLDARVNWTPSPREGLAVRARTRMRPLDDGLGVVRGSALAIELDAEHLDLARLQPWVAEHTIRGRVDAMLRITGTARDPKIVASLDGSNLCFDDLVIDAVQTRLGHDDGRVALDVGAHAPWIDSVQLTASLPIRLAAVAPYSSFDPGGPAEVVLAVDHLDLSGLDRFVPGLGLRGHTDGTLVAAVEDGALTGAADVLVRDLAHDRDRIATVSLEAKLDDQALVATLLASGPAARLVQVDATVPLRVDVRRATFEWLADDPHHVALALADADIAALGRLAGVDRFSGRIDGTATLDGTPRGPTITAELQARRLAKDSHVLGRVDIDAEHAAGRVRVRALQRHGRQRLGVVADVPVTIDLAALAFDWDRDAEHTVDVDAVGIDRALFDAFVELPDDAVFVANAELHAHGNLGGFAARGQLRATLGDAGVLGTPVAARFSLDEAEQEVEVVLGPFADRAIEITARTQAPLAVLLDGGAASWDSVPVVASLDTDGFRLSALDPLVPDAVDEPSGRLDAHLKLDGTLGSPNLRGGVAVVDGAVTVVPMRQRFDRVELAIALDGRDLRLTRFSARSGAGRARATGRLHVEAGATVAALDVDVDGLAIVRPGLPMMKLTSHATATLDATGATTEIDVLARKSTLDVFTESMTAPKALPDATGVVYVDARGRAAASAEGAVDPDAAAALLPPDMNVRLVLADALYVRGPQANMTWRGKLELSRQGDAEIRAEGALVVDRGRISFLGSDFVIDSGSLTLPAHGELDPYIELTAVTQTPEGAVTIDVHGRVSRPELRLSSDPPLAESDVFALLVTGSSSGAKDGAGPEVEAKAANLLAAFENPVLQRELQDRLGIDRVGITFGDTVEQPIVAVGKRVAPKIYLETRYHHNAPLGDNHAELHLQYEIKAPSWSVETFIGDAAKGGLELWWRKRFGRRERVPGSEPRFPSFTGRRRGDPSIPPAPRPRR